MTNDGKRLWHVVLAAFGITAVGLWFGLKRLLWRLWIALTILWLGFWAFAEWMLKEKDRARELADPSFWLIVIGPPVFALLMVALLAWIIDGLRGDIAERSSESRPSQSSEEAKRRRGLGYD